MNNLNIKKKERGFTMRNCKFLCPQCSSPAPVGKTYPTKSGLIIRYRNCKKCNIILVTKNVDDKEVLIHDYKPGKKHQTYA